MATGNLRTSRAYCSHCKMDTKCEKNGLVWGGGDIILMLITSGIWILLKIVFSERWRCATCGAKV